MLLAVMCVALGVVPAGVRVNRALQATHSRRETNRLIAEGRLAVNGVVASNPDSRLVPGDVVLFDGVPVAWDTVEPHVYIKFNKPVGVECTTNRNVKNNIMDALQTAGHEAARRIYPIGRLDVNSSGLILLTSNGAIVNTLLRAREGKRKIYDVITEPSASKDDIRRLASGIVITTLSRINGETAPVTAATRPCEVSRCGPSEIRFVLEEGRNRQIRRMCAALSLDVERLHRVSFSGVSLSSCEEPGEWAPLTEAEELQIGARRPLTRSERRTPEERARRKARGKRNR